ncbi:MAG: undecaprenyldiphospho-muramoylpentapeptide beta-N-acetylglucosaminyltransferase [Clostridiales bacterium]|nr:undecaprenyldiphospho-muramoylpentapeptide beta-N-acetylglucosaminyltransferase [Clostridiales bacterium]
MAKIILTGGGTAGHVTPHLAILPYIKKDFDSIYYIGSENGIEKNIIKQASIPYYSVPCAKLNRSFTFKNFTIPIKLISGYIKAGKILDMIKPDIIFSKGGYVAVPIILAAKKRKIPIIAHESDYSIGLANKLTAKYCKKVLTSFKDTAKSLKNGEFVGPPIRKNLLSTKPNESLEFFGFTGNKPILLITGGSQGAMAINTAIRNSLENLLPKFDIIHICGKGNLSKDIKNKGYFQTEYLNNIEIAFSVCSVCVSRAGSNTVFELLALKIPSILIPLPKGNSRGDQVVNAEYFQKLGLVTVLPQNVLTPESLSLAINSTYSNRHNLKRSFDESPITDSSRQISRILIESIN